VSHLTVVGGLYREHCRSAQWDRVFGSGGRAAASVSSHVENITFRTYASKTMAEAFLPEVVLDGVAVNAETVEQEILFDYAHCLATPAIYPPTSRIEKFDPLDVSGDCVLRFGMLEGDARVTAARCVYDPQSAFDPKPFSANGSSADVLAVVGNRREILALGCATEVREAASCLLSGGADVVVAKLGAEGADVFTKRGVERVLPRASEEVFSLGSGDVFAAVFAARWMIHGDEPLEAASLASAAVSSYAELRALPVPETEDLRGRSECVRWKGGLVYLAGPFFTIGQRWLIDEARVGLQQLGMKVFSPAHDVGPGPARKVAQADREGLERSDVVFAVLDGLDSGTLFEVGYARAREKPVYALAQRVSAGDLKMLEGTGCRVFDDLVTAIHKVAWRA